MVDIRITFLYLLQSLHTLLVLPQHLLSTGKLDSCVVNY